MGPSDGAARGPPADRASDGAAPSIAVSVVLPAYNEASTIESTVETTLGTLGDFLEPGTFEVIVAEDGCDDRTPEIADRLAAADDRVRHFHSDERLGRGGALEHAFEAAHGDVLVYFDTDLATDMRHLEELVERVRSGEADVATGSRWMPENVADRPAKRGVPSRVYNGLVRTFLRSDLRDHQCGFKAFSREALETLAEEVEDDHWFWDTEMLVRAQRAGYEVTEFPVDWTPKGDTKVDLVRDVLGMGSQILRTWWQLSVRPRLSQRVGLAAGAVLAVLALVLMTQYLDFGTVLAEMRDADPALVGAAALVYVLSWPLRGFRYQDILTELGYREQLSFLTGAVFISQTGNLVFPARAGDLIRAYVVKARRGIPYPSGFASLAAERVFDLLTIASMAGVVLLGYTATGQTAELARTVVGAEGAGRVAVVVAMGVGLVAIAAVIGIALSARSDRDVVTALVYRVSTDSYADFVAGVIGRFVGDLQTVAGTRRGFARVGATSVLVWTLDVVTALLVLAAFSPGLPAVELIAVSFFAVSVGNLAKVLPLSPGGVGLYEGAFTLLVVGLTPLGAELALGAAVLDHAVKNIVTVIGGYASMLGLNVSLTTAVEETRDVREAREEAPELD
ncbi:TIGR00374 family protein [Halobellus sp. Atlit-38R]|uniref:flippase-like domain-containing protein n=1 Tax=Halobellus sp. Atlit-38R TaxID=2282131 RepID=UPI000EF20776|nr:flippase-like domain-containing protein [Halobellus sp. Atlit-38R]RLM94563.1 TIGR00374 family protein [Halobellus sp. Atlit-38R]